MSKDKEFIENDELVAENDYISGDVQVFDIEDINNIAIGRSGGSGLYGAVRTVCDEIMGEATKGKGVMVRAIVKKVRELLKEQGEDDPGYQPVCVRLRNLAASSKKYRLVTNPQRVSFIVKR